MSEQTPLHQYMSNLHDQGRYDDAVRERGEHFAIADPGEQKVLLQASYMVLEVCHRLQISPSAMKAKIGRTEANEV